MLRAGRAWFLVSAWSLHGLSFNLAGWELLIGYTSFSGCDDERALHALACGLICLVIQLLAAFIDIGPVLLG
jgi:hypothetical protein